MTLYANPSWSPQIHWFLMISCQISWILAFFMGEIIFKFMSEKNMEKNTVISWKH